MEREKNGSATLDVYKPNGVQNGKSYIKIYDVDNPSDYKIISVIYGFCVNLPEVPRGLWSYYTTFKVTALRTGYTDCDWSPGYEVEVYYTGTKIRGSQSMESCPFTYQLLDSNNVVVDSGTEYTNAIGLNQSTSGHFTLYHLQRGEYTLNLPIY